LVTVTRESLGRGIAQAVAGNRVMDISRGIQETVELAGFSVVRQFVGHGIGRKMHEDPQIANFVKKGEGREKLKPGMTLAIEPMVNMGDGAVDVMSDGWTVLTRDRKPSAHFEHTIAVTDSGPEILTRGKES
jgi:methionyl aminopeptidase